MNFNNNIEVKNYLRNQYEKIHKYLVSVVGKRMCEISKNFIYLNQVLDNKVKVLFTLEIETMVSILEQKMMVLKYQKRRIEYMSSVNETILNLLNNQKNSKQEKNNFISNDLLVIVKNEINEIDHLKKSFEHLIIIVIDFLNRLDFLRLNCI
jgi:hypothetical protein